jgi:hypothetical protein
MGMHDQSERIKLAKVVAKPSNKDRFLFFFATHVSPAVLAPIAADVRIFAGNETDF